MRRLRLLLLLLPFLAGPVAAETGCAGGRDLIAELPAAKRAALVAGVPFASGNFWQARKGNSTITLAGTYHLNDPRFDALMPKLLPYLERASTLLVEAGPEEEAKVKADVAAHPEQIANLGGPTLPEVLPEAEWQKLSRELAAQGIPAIVAAKLQPWYVATLLELPVCKVTPALLDGLDNRLIAAAQARHIPIRALEPWDTALRLMAGLTRPQQIALLRMTLAAPGSPADAATTLSNAYFAGQAQLVWAWSQTQAGATAAERTEFAPFEAALLTGRNESWVAPILAASRHAEVMVAVGAAHLGGKDGLLDLLAARGFTVTRLPF